MKKIVLLFILALPLGAMAQSDTTYWNKGGGLGLNFNQATLSNWAAGGNNSISGAGYFNVFFDYKKDRVIWNNSLDMGMGFIKNEGEEERKADDRFVFISNYGKRFKAKDYWYFSAALDFRTQLAKGYGTDENQTGYISKFLAPAYMLASIGLDWKPNDFFNVSFGLASGKFTFVNDKKLSDAGAFGVDEGSKSRSELGGTIKANLNKEIMKNVQYKSSLILFSNYLENADKIDVNWENTITMKINDILSANIYNQLIYDYDVKFYDTDLTGADILETESEKWQFKNIIALGLTVKFGGVRK